jgi:cell division protease FtsH
MMGVGKSRAKVYDETKPGLRFADIAGYESSRTEVTEVVDFLRNPQRSRRAGRRARRVS